MIAMEPQLSYATKEDIWRLQETLGEISATQVQQSDRIMRLERRRDDDSRVKSVWGPGSPFTSVLGSSHPGISSTLFGGRANMVQTPT
jgi:hypothetical protein